MRRVASTLASAFLALAAIPALAQTQCWVEREELLGKRDPKWTPLWSAVLKAEALGAANQAFLNTPVPVRMQSSIEAGDWGASVWLYPFPEKTKYSQVWSKEGKCAIHPASSTIGAMIGSLGVKFNVHVGDYFLKGHEVPQFDGTVGGYPVYNGWVVITRDGRLPWLPQTLADRLNREASLREKKLAEWRTSQARMKMPDEAATRKTYDMLKKADPAGAEKFLVSQKESTAELKRLQGEVYPATTRKLEQSVAEVARYRATFTAQQLAAPATWADRSGEGRKRLEASARELRALPPDAKHAIDALTQENRALTRQMQDAQRAKDTAQADSLKAQIAELTGRARAIRQQHEEKAAVRIVELGDQFALENLKPGDMSNVLAYKADPSLPDQKDINRIQVILVALHPKGQTEGRGEWMKATRDSYDFAALAAMLK